jgi:LAO/AO transport system kinase
MSLEMSLKKEDGWEPPILKTEAILGKGIFELVYGVYRHKQSLEQNLAFEKKKRERTKAILLEILNSQVTSYFVEKIEREGKWEPIINDLMNRRTDPYTVVENIMSTAFKKD